LEKLTNNRLYLDYNATSPLAKSVVKLFAEGSMSFANPSSIHSSGKRARKSIKETERYLKDLFCLSNFKIFFHSGATEGINTIIRGYAKNFWKKGKGLHIFYSEADHSCVSALKEDLADFGHTFHSFPVDKNGEFVTQDLIHEMKKLAVSGEEILLNYTYVNNETGVVWPLQEAIKIKKAVNCKIHVDAVQAPGKIDNWEALSNELDAYTFSGHKFGALKGIGFTLFKEDLSFSPLILGGGQQEGIRSGTINVTGINSLKLALEELSEGFDYKKSQQTKLHFEKELRKRIPSEDELVIVGKDATYRNLNCVTLIFKKVNISGLVTALDIKGIDVGVGSACSSGIFSSNRVLKSMGFSDQESKQSIRVSWGYKEDQQFMQKIVEVIFDSYKMISS
jgi:cysteine desulfurase